MEIRKEIEEGPEIDPQDHVPPVTADSEKEGEEILLAEGTDKMVRIGTDMTAETREDLIKLRREYADLFAFSGQDIPECLRIS